MAVLGIKSQSIIEELLLFQSQTWTCHQTGLVKVVCIGGGGSGAFVTSRTNGMEPLGKQEQELITRVMA